MWRHYARLQEFNRGLKTRYGPDSWSRRKVNFKQIHFTIVSLIVSISVLVSSDYCNKIPYMTDKFSSHSLEGSKNKLKTPADLVSDDGPLLSVLALSAHCGLMRWKEPINSLAPPLRALIPFRRAEPLFKDLISNSITLGMKFGRNSNIITLTAPFSPLHCVTKKGSYVSEASTITGQDVGK